jgi:hypothetical protein
MYKTPNMSVNPDALKRAGYFNRYAHSQNENNWKLSVLTFAALLFLGGLFTLFWAATPGETTEYRLLSRTYAGNGGMAARGADYRGGATAVTSMEYLYKVDNITYTGHCIRFSGGPPRVRKSPTHQAPVMVYYLQAFPSISVIDRGIPFFTIFILILTGLGLIQMHNWFLAHTEAKPV